MNSERRERFWKSANGQLVIFCIWAVFNVIASMIMFSFWRAGGPQTGLDQIYMNLVRVALIAGVIVCIISFFSRISKLREERNQV